MRVAHRSIAPLVAAAAGLLVVAIAAHSGHLHLIVAGNGPSPGPPPARPTTTPPALGTLPNASPSPARSTGGASNLWIVVGWLVLIAVAVLLARGVLAALRTGRRVRAHPTHPTESAQQPVAATADELTGAVDAGLDLLATGPVSDAVIACWLRVGEAAAAAGLYARPAETSAEFTDRVLGQHGVRDAPLHELAALYREARFSNHPMSDRARADARRCLQDIRADLRSAHV